MPNANNPILRAARDYLSPENFTVEPDDYEELARQLEDLDAGKDAESEWQEALFDLRGRHTAEMWTHFVSDALLGLYNLANKAWLAPGYEQELLRQYDLANEEADENRDASGDLTGKAYEYWEDSMVSFTADLAEALRRRVYPEGAAE